MERDVVRAWPHMVVNSGSRSKLSPSPNLSQQHPTPPAAASSLSHPLPSQPNLPATISLYSDPDSILSGLLREGHARYKLK